MKQPTPDLVEFKLFRRKEDNMATKPIEDPAFELHPQAPSKWRIDHSVPLALVLTFVSAIAVQTVVGTWWMSSFQTQTVAKLENLDSRQKLVDALPERMARQEAQITALTGLVKDIKDDFREFSNRGTRK